MPSAKRTDHMPPRIETRSAPLSRDRSIAAAFDAIHCRALANTAWHAEPIVVLSIAVTSLCVSQFSFDSAGFGMASFFTRRFQYCGRMGKRFLGRLPGVVLLLDSAVQSVPVASTASRFRFAIAGHEPALLGLSGPRALDDPSGRLLLLVSCIPARLSVSRLRGRKPARLAVLGKFVRHSVYRMEFFYRGFLLFTLERYIGVYSIFVMVIPYCMVHFGKPFVESWRPYPPA